MVIKTRRTNDPVNAHLRLEIIYQKILFDYQAILVKIFEYYDNLHVYRPGVGAPGVQIIFRIFNLQSLCPFPSTISLQKTFYNFPHSMHGRPMSNLL